MRIRTRLQIMIASSLALIVLMALLFAWSQERFTRAARAGDLADQIVITIFERTLLTRDYLRNDTLPARARWQAKQRQADDLIGQASLAFDSAVARKNIRAMQESSSKSSELFRQLAANRDPLENGRSDRARAAGIENELVGQLLETAADTIADARRLQELSKQSVVSTQKTVARISFAFIVAVMLLVMIVARSLGRIFRSGIGQLRQGALAIGAGDLHHLIPLAGSDELTEVAGAFNAMAARLESSYAAFEREIAFRTRVEDDLRLERHHLQDVQEQLGLLAKRMSLATRSGGIGVWEWSVATGQLLFDARMFELYDLDPLRAVSVYDEWRERVHPADLQHIESEIEATLACRQQLDDEFRIVISSGQVRHIKTSAFVERDGDGRARRMVGVNWDISETRENERALEEARRQAEEASRAKSEFVANMSHEIRTPMNAIVGMLYLLRQTGLSVRQADYAAKMQAATGSLLGIIDDILDFSKIEAGRLEIEAAPFRLHQVMDRLVDVVNDGARRKGIGFVLRLPDDVPDLIMGDPLRLGQVLVNLTGNAIKFTECGQVVVEVQSKGTAGSEARVRFSIRDTGIGMSSGQLARLFAPFTQADSSISRRYGGSGLGLTISRRLVELMGGTLEIESFPGAAPFAASSSGS